MVKSKQINKGECIVHQKINAVKKKMVDGILWQSSGLELHTLRAEGPSLIPGQGTKIPQAGWLDQKQQQKKKMVDKGKESMVWVYFIYLLFYRGIIAM